MSETRADDYQTYPNDNPYCPKCGRPYIYIGDWFDKYNSPVCQCNQQNKFQPQCIQYGWICSRCGRSNAPTITECPCKISFVGDETVLLRDWQDETVLLRDWQDETEIE